MADRDLAAEIRALDTTLTDIEKVINLPHLRNEVARLESEAGTPDLWNNPENAQKVTSALSRVQSTLNKVMALRNRISDLPVMIELAEGEPESGADDDIIKEQIGRAHV